MDKYYQDTKECPMCAETVKAKAIICRFCRHEFEFETEEINPPAMDSHESDPHASTTTFELDQFDGEEPNADDYYEFTSTENPPVDKTPVEKALAEESPVEDEEEEESPVEEPILDDKGWKTFNEFTSTENPPATTKYDVWITSAYNDKVCNTIIDITNWDAPVAGKFLLDLEDYGDAKKLIEEVDIDEAERIKNKLEEAGVRVTVKSHI